MNDPRVAIAKSFSRLEESIQFSDLINEGVSAWSVGMQIHHTLLAANAILGFLNSSKPGAEKQSRSLMRTAILKAGRIPRGRGKSPDAALPAEAPARETLEQLLSEARQKLSTSETTSPDAWWDHHMFGTMTLNTALKFLNVHTEHHLSIIDDIRNAEVTQ